jgi:hypothetical protein
MDKICDACGKVVKSLAKKEPPTCKKCYKRPTEKCSICHIKRRVEKRDGDKRPICSSCYKTPIIKCIKCNELKNSYKKEKDGHICQKCYWKEYNLPVETCSLCGHDKEVYKRNKDSSPICRYCYNKNYKLPEEKCNLCNRKRPVCARRNKKPLCKVCNNKWKMIHDPEFYVKELIRSRTKMAFKRYVKNGKVKPSKEYGIDYQNIFNHIGPCPGKRNRYHIDHIFPLSAFDFSNPVHIIAAFAPENHQWISSKDNLQKHAKYNKKSFEKYITEFGKIYEEETD